MRTSDFSIAKATQRQTANSNSLNLLPVQKYAMYVSNKKKEKGGKVLRLHFLTKTNVWYTEHHTRTRSLP